MLGATRNAQERCIQEVNLIRLLFYSISSINLYSVAINVATRVANWIRCHSVAIIVANKNRTKLKRTKKNIKYSINLLYNTVLK